MRKRITVIGLCVAAAALASAVAAAGASASINYLWTEEGSSFEANLSVTAGILTGTTFNVRALVTIGGTHTNVVIKCSAATLNNGVIFDKPSREGRPVGQGHGELELTTCTSNACTSGATIKLPPLGNAETTVVADKSELSTIEKVYDDFLPNSSKEFTSFTLEAGACGVIKTYKIITKLTRGGLGVAKEGEGGVLGEVDNKVSEAEANQATHRLKFECSGNSQLQTKAFNADREEVMVGQEEVEGVGNGPACFEGTITLKLANNHSYKLV